MKTWPSAIHAHHGHRGLVLSTDLNTSPGYASERPRTSRAGGPSAAPARLLREPPDRCKNQQYSTASPPSIAVAARARAGSKHGGGQTEGSPPSRPSLCQKPSKIRQHQEAQRLHSFLIPSSKRQQLHPGWGTLGNGGLFPRYILRCRSGSGGRDRAALPDSPVYND